MKYLADHQTVETDNVDHSIMNCIDDNNSMLTFKDKNITSKYTTSYMYLLFGFYNLNITKIIEMKVNILIVEKFENKDTKTN